MSLCGWNAVPTSPLLLMAVCDSTGFQEIENKELYHQYVYAGKSLQQSSVQTELT
jgi:hypothetical protein